ncbi:hypothetical protein MAR_018328 [Mya arenaria]|uniref:Tyr recombinase domain-containing protein n=1 Tax=Mya arenaria TaxID=6604 RepID=A0ABY7EES9_MYAAR|nr:hypothetical protein MAR_018328 [Mya arenaria]
MCDLLSRFQVKKALRLAPQLDPNPLPIPHHTDKPLTILIKSQSPLCPVKALQAYFLVRGDHDGPLFVSSISFPISVAKFRSVFNELLVYANLSSSHYKLHSFRIGACTQAALLWVPDNEIIRMGRWLSNAFRRYIRLPNISS